MRFKAWDLYRFVLVGGTLVALGCAPSGVWAQQTQSNDQAQSSMQTAGQAQFQAQGQMQDVHWSDWAAFDEFLKAHPDVDQALRANPDLVYDQGFMGQHHDLQDFCNSHPGVEQDMNRHHGQFQDWFSHRGELASLRQFFDTHAWVEQALLKNPSLVDDQTFLKGQPALAQFLQSHPNVQQAFDQNPSRFMTLEVRFEINTTDRFAVAEMDRFFDSHEDIAKALAANPSLVENKSFLSAHPALQEFLASHHEVQQIFVQNPTLFMNLEARYEGSPADQYADAHNGFYNRGGNGRENGNGNPNANGNPNPNPDLTRGEVASMNQFLESNPKIAQQLEANPSLINNGKYLSENPQLRAFLNEHPQVREEFTENPSFFMQRESQFAENGGQAGVATMDAYLDKHHDEARDLNAYPARVNDSDYLSHHKDLADFLKKHPDVREEFTHNPSAFMHQESSFDACAQMDDFLGHHRDVAKDLDSNPDNVKDASYLDHHKDLKGFLAKNPGVGDQFRGNPGDFMSRERRFESDRQMDVYLSSHKSVAKDLEKNPDQVKDAQYLDHHKDLKQLFDKNPQLAQAANTDPAGFWQEQVKFRENYRNQQINEKTKVQERATTHGPQ